MNLYAELLHKMNINDSAILNEIVDYANGNSELLSLLALEHRRTLMGDRNIYANDNYRSNKLEEALRKNSIPDSEIAEIMAIDRESMEDEEEDNEDDNERVDVKQFCLVTGVLLKEIYSEILTKCPLFIAKIGNSFGSTIALASVILRHKYKSLMDIPTDITTEFMKYVRANIVNTGITTVHRNYIFHAYVFYLCMVLGYGYMDMPEILRGLIIIDKITGENECISTRFISELIVRSLLSKPFYDKLIDRSDEGKLLQIVMLCSVIDMIDDNNFDDVDNCLRKLDLSKNDAILVRIPYKKQVFVVEHMAGKKSVYRIHRVRANDIYLMNTITDQFVEKIVYSLNDAKLYLDQRDKTNDVVEQDRKKDEVLMVSLKRELYRERDNMFMRNVVIVMMLLVIGVIVVFLNRRDVRTKIKNSANVVKQKVGIDYLM
jgi:hypothetical protein